MMGIRFAAYEQQLAALRDEVVTVNSLKAELAVLRERLAQNFSNSSKPLSSDHPLTSLAQGANRSGKRRATSHAGFSLYKHRRWILLTSQAIKRTYTPSGYRSPAHLQSATRASLNIR
jgi:hypothetical protein